MWLIPSLEYICFRKLRFTQPPLFHTAGFYLFLVLFVCFVLIQYSLFPALWWLSGTAMQSELHCTKHYANTQQQLQSLPPCILLCGYTVQTCSYLSSELPSFHLWSLTADHPPFTHIQIKHSSSLRWLNASEESQDNLGVSVPLTLIIALIGIIHIFIQAASYEQLTNPSEQHFILQHNSCVFKHFLF